MCAPREPACCAPTTPAACSTCGPPPTARGWASRCDTSRRSSRARLRSYGTLTPALSQRERELIERGDELLKIKLPQRVGQRHTGVFVPAHGAVVVPLHDRPCLFRMTVKRAAVLRIADVPRTRLLDISGQPVADVERAHQMHDLAPFAQRVERRVVQAGHGIERMQLEQQILAVKATDAQ